MEAFRQNGYKFVIRSNDHEPPHVHVLKAGGEIVFDLGSNTVRPGIRENRGMSIKSAKAAFKICCERQQELLDAWSEVHGEE